MTEARGSGSRTVAVLLALAAILAAVVSARAGLYASDATSAWTAAVGSLPRRRRASIPRVSGPQPVTASATAAPRMRTRSTSRPSGVPPTEARVTIRHVPGRRSTEQR